MYLRYSIEFSFSLLITIMFQYYITEFNHYLHAANIEVYKLLEIRGIDLSGGAGESEESSSSAHRILKVLASRLLGGTTTTESTDTGHDTHSETGDFHDSEAYKHEVYILHHDLKIAAHDLNEAMIISCIQLMFPINILTKYYFLKMTNRQSLQITP